MNDLVSVIMPAYNTAEYIDASVRSVLDQTYRNLELIIVDDFSDDGTEKIISGYSDERIVLLRNECREGAAYSRNRALKQARGRWIAFLDSDDLWHPEKLEKQIAFMAKNGYAFSYTCYSEIDKGGANTGITVSGPDRITKHGMFRYCWPGCLTVMYDSSRVGLVQIEEIARNNDYAMWLKVCRKADCYLLKEILASYRRGRNNSISSVSRLRLIKWHYRLFRTCEKRSPLVAAGLTLGNIFWGVFKKVKYVTKDAGT